MALELELGLGLELFTASPPARTTPEANAGCDNDIDIACISYGRRDDAPMICDECRCVITGIDDSSEEDDKSNLGATPGE